MIPAGTAVPATAVGDQYNVVMNGELTVSYAEGVLSNDSPAGISTGAVPFVPPIEGSDKKGVFTFTELSSAKAFKEYIKENK